MGKLCKSDGTWDSACVNAHQCGYVVSSGVDECGVRAEITDDYLPTGRLDSFGNPITCQDLGYGTSVNCTNVNGVYKCVGTGGGTTAQRYFIGCGGNASVTAGATGAVNDPTANCYQYVDSSEKVCVADEPYSCGAAVGAEAATTAICNQSCSDTVLCSDGTQCTNGTCQNPGCPGDSDCVCDTYSTTSTTTTTSTGTYACVEMTNQSGVSTIAPGQVIYFTERYSTTYATCPFTQSAVRLLVSSSGTTATGVGGAYNNGNTPTSLLVPAVSLSTSSSGGTLYCDYNFVWQATNTNATDVADGTYSVHYLTNTSDSSKVTTPAACVESLVVSSTEEIEPAFTLLKSSAAVCLDNGGATINYTVTARNVSSVSGAIDRVTDDLPSEIPDNQISNISDSGVLSGGIITWTGPYTLAAGASRSFTYRATLTEAQVIALDEDPVYNKATIIYDTPSTQDNSIDFDLATYVTCLPGTGLFDSTEGLVLIGFILIIGGILFNRTGMAVVIAESGVGKAIGNLTSQVGSYESKVERAQERKIKNRRK